MHQFKLQILENELTEYANAYHYQDDAAIVEIGNLAKQEKYLTYEQFLTVCAWKTLRSKSRCTDNKRDFVQEVTECVKDWGKTNTNKIKNQKITMSLLI